MPTIVLYGPPGAGKSTILRHFALLGVRAVDLETFPPTERAWAASNWHRGSMPTLLGGADLRPSDFPRRDTIRHVLLLPPRDVYDGRRAKRDNAMPHKAGQPDVYHNFEVAKCHFHAIARVDGDIVAAMREINSIHRRYFGTDIEGY